MNDLIKAVRLEFLLEKQYIKYLIYFSVIAIFLQASSKSLMFGIVIAMTLIPLKVVSFAFQCEEKNDINKLYGLFPMEKYKLVIGRYLYMIIVGVVALIIALIAQSFILTYTGIKLETIDYIRSSIIGISVYTFNISLQLPGFYKFGSIKGAFFSYIPIIFCILTFCFIGGFESLGLQPIPVIMENLTLFSLVFFGVSIIFLLVSAIMSSSIYKTKE